MEMAGTQFVINLRYLLMSCALSQKISPDLPFFHRLFMSYGITDEIFGISAAVDGNVNPFYVYGALTVAVPGWTIGTWLGAASGNILPPRVLSALNVAIYGMFIAIIVPPARKEKVLAGMIGVSMAASLLAARLPLISQISSGMRIMILTVLIAWFGAVLFPIHEKESGEEDQKEQRKEVFSDER